MAARIDSPLVGLRISGPVQGIPNTGLEPASTANTGLNERCSVSSTLPPGCQGKTRVQRYIKSSRGWNSAEDLASCGFPSTTEKVMAHQRWDPMAATRQPSWCAVCSLDNGLPQFGERVDRQGYSAFGGAPFPLFVLKEDADIDQIMPAITCEREAHFLGRVLSDPCDQCIHARDPPSTSPPIDSGMLFCAATALKTTKKWQRSLVTDRMARAGAALEKAIIDVV
jgi:hypothetical protein